ncbi:hypothetical protein AOQ71_04110 [Bradyrhizobium manausense]|uniref:Uncharacterized protein n=1 Tax=Bradyrhizobium manausense TaxID=989370 RepID=A0A0R3E4E8_9BRAD|nr:hypothetical protein AOQ71_04110 [Bradyrhizobium manausense]
MFPNSASLPRIICSSCETGGRGGADGAIEAGDAQGAIGDCQPALQVVEPCAEARIFAELIVITGFHRKHATQLLRGAD